MTRTLIVSILFLFSINSPVTAHAGRPPWDDTKKPPPEKKDGQKPPDKQGSK